MNGCPVSQYVARADSLLNGHKCRSSIKLCTLSPAMVMFPYEFSSGTKKTLTNNNKKAVECFPKVNWLYGIDFSMKSFSSRV